VFEFWLRSRNNQKLSCSVQLSFAAARATVLKNKLATSSSTSRSEENAQFLSPFTKTNFATHQHHTTPVQKTLIFLKIFNPPKFFLKHRTHFFGWWHHQNTRVREDFEVNS
jgi:hypothetical protein